MTRNELLNPFDSDEEDPYDPYADLVKSAPSAAPPVTLPKTAAGQINSSVQLSQTSSNLPYARTTPTDLLINTDLLTNTDLVKQTTGVKSDDTSQHSEGMCLVPNRIVSRNILDPLY